jgi:hypothetical protein
MILALSCASVSTAKEPNTDIEQTDASPPPKRIIIPLGANIMWKLISDLQALKLVPPSRSSAQRRASLSMAAITPGSHMSRTVAAALRSNGLFAGRDESMGLMVQFAASTRSVVRYPSRCQKRSDEAITLGATL